MIIALLVVIAVAAFLVVIYNGLVTLKNKVNEAWSDIDVQLKRRYDLIPNLVETVKGYAQHEKSVFEEVTKARSQAMAAQSPGEKGEAELSLAGALKTLFAVAESYPDLKASDNFQDLQNQLAEIESAIQNSRRFYNGNVRDFNTKVEVFPNNLVAPILGFKRFDFFELADAKERENVSVKF